MQNNQEYILFLTNYSNKGGANNVLFSLVKYLVENTNFKTIILFPSEGNMINEFKKYSTTIILDNNSSKNKIRHRIKNHLRKLLKLPDIKYKNTIKKLREYNIRLIYSNTSHNEISIKHLSVLNKPLIIHSHEQEYILNLYKNKPYFKEQFNLTNIIISVCDKTTEGILEHFKSVENKIIKIYPGINLKSISKLKKKTSREIIGISQNDFIVIAMGNPHWIKGCDLFLQVAINTIKKDKTIKFYWIGGDEFNFEYQRLKNDIKKIGYSENIFQIKHTSDPFLYHSISDLFILTSRVDSFPLVNLQSGLFKVPVLCFDKSGGSTEIINEKTGFVVPYADTDAMAEKIIFLKKNPEILKQKGKNLYKQVTDKFDEIAMTKKITIQIKNTI